MTDLSIIILNYNTKELLKKCLHSILDKKWKNKIEIWVVDNASSDGSAEMMKKEFPKINLIQNHTNSGFSKGNNLALEKIQSSYCLLLNSDTEVSENSLDIMIESMNKNKFDLISCKLINTDGTLQPNAGDLPFGLPLYTWLFGLDDLPLLKNILSSFHRTQENYYNKERTTGWISGTAFMITNNALKKIGLLDENIFMYCEDVDYCIRANRLGLTVGFTNQVQIKHVGGANSKDPRLNQWTGEFKNLIYLHRKYRGSFSAIFLKISIYKAIFLRILAFSILGKSNHVKTYFKILKNL